MQRLNRRQRVVVLVASALAFVALVRFGIREGSSTEVIPQETVSVPSSSPDTAGAVGTLELVDQPMGPGDQFLVVLGALVLWVVIAVVVLKQPHGDDRPDGNEA